MNDRKPGKQRSPKSDHSGQKSPRIAPEVQARIGARLRAMYDDVVEEGVPDRFASLLRQLESPPDEK